MLSSPKQGSMSRKRSPSSSSSRRGSDDNNRNGNGKGSTNKKTRFNNDDRSTFNSPRKLSYEIPSSPAHHSARLSQGNTASSSDGHGNGKGNGTGTGTGNDFSYNYSSQGSASRGGQGSLNRECYGYENTNNNSYGRLSCGQYDPNGFGAYNPSHDSVSNPQHLHGRGPNHYGHHDNAPGPYGHQTYGDSPSSHHDHGSVHSHGDRVLPPPRGNSNSNTDDATYARQNGQFLSCPSRGNSNSNAFDSSFNYAGHSPSPYNPHAYGFSPSAYPVHGSGYYHGGQFAPYPHENSNNPALGSFSGRDVQAIPHPHGNSNDTTCGSVYGHGEFYSQFSSPNKPSAEFQICSPTPQKNPRSTAVLPERNQSVGWLFDDELPEQGQWYDIDDYKSVFHEKLKLDRHQSRFYDSGLNIDQRRELLKLTENHLPFDMHSLEQKKRIVRDEKKREQDRKKSRVQAQAAAKNILIQKVLDSGAQERDTVAKQYGGVNETLDGVRETVEGTSNNLAELVRGGIAERNKILDILENDGRDGLENTLRTTIEPEAEDRRPEYALKDYMYRSDHCPRSLAQEGMSNGHHLLKTAFSGVKNFEGIERTVGFGPALKIVKDHVPSFVRPELKTLEDCLWPKEKEDRPHGVAIGRNGPGHRLTFVDLPRQNKFVVKLNQFSTALVAIVNAIPGSKVRATYDTTRSVRCVCPPLTAAEDENNRLKDLVAEKDKGLAHKNEELSHKNEELEQQKAETERMKRKVRLLTQTLFKGMGPEQGREALEEFDQMEKHVNYNL